MQLPYQVHYCKRGYANHEASLIWQSQSHLHFSPVNALCFILPEAQMQCSLESTGASYCCKGSVICYALCLKDSVICYALCLAAAPLMHLILAVKRQHYHPARMIRCTSQLPVAYDMLDSEVHVLVLCSNEWQQPP